MKGPRRYSRRGNGVSLSFERGTLLLAGLGGNESPAALGPPVWTWDARVGRWRCDAIHYVSIRAVMQARFGAGFHDEVPAVARVAWPKTDLPPLRPEQTEALAAWTNAGRRGQIIMPTGTGKTEVAFAAMARTQIATLIVAPVRDLMYQWHRRILATFGCDAGIVGDNLFDIKPVTGRMEEIRANLLTTQEIRFDDQGYPVRRVVVNPIQLALEEMRLTLGGANIVIENEDGEEERLFSENVSREQFYADIDKLPIAARQEWTAAVRRLNPVWLYPF